MKRVKAFKTNAGVDEYIEHLNAALQIGEASISETVEVQQWPLIFLVGPSRSGTTLFTQWASQCGFGTPLNLTARFYKNPYIAGLIQRLLVDEKLHYRDELHCGISNTYQSAYGKTGGCLSPHEFSHFFRRFFPSTLQLMEAKDIENSDPAGFINGLNLFATAMQRPILLKGFLLQYNLDLISSYPNAFFIHCNRHAVDNICSIANHRTHVGGDIRQWISVRPPGYDEICNLEPYEQMAAQVTVTNEYMSKQLQKIPAERHLSVSYESFCESPGTIYEAIKTKLDHAGFENLLDSYEGPDSFPLKKYDSSTPEYQLASDALVKTSDICKATIEQYAVHI